MLGAAVDIRRWLRADRHTPHLERLTRDRNIGRTLPVGATADERVIAWWAQISPGEETTTGDRLERLRQVATTVVTLVGLVVGASLSGVAFGYDGDYPVNLFALLGVLVGIPLILLLFTLLLLPGRVPGLAAVQGVLGGMNAGRWVGAWLDRYAQTDLFAAYPIGRKTSAFARWQVVVFSQWLAIGFFAGVLGVACLLVGFTDLAFGWSTTLQVEAENVHSWFSALAMPWSGWLPVAAPDAALVEISRYYRLEDSTIPAVRAARLGAWWPFVLMTVATYGLLPRLVLFSVAVWRLNVACRSLLRDDPEVTALVDRLTLPPVGFEGEAEDAADAPDEILSVPPALGVDEDASTLIVIWNDALPEHAANLWFANRFGVRAETVLGLGIVQGQAQHRVRLERISAEIQRCVIFTKGWEPPLLEFSDFLGLLREVLGDVPSLILVPIDVSGKRVLEHEREVWSRALARRHDSGLYAVAADDLMAGQT